jgi:hypothetical protein
MLSSSFLLVDSLHCQGSPFPISLVVYRWWKPEYLEKTTDLAKLIDKFDHIMLYRVHLAISDTRTHNFSGTMH